MREWNADTYHRVSNPQLQWGLAVLDRLELRGDEVVADVGCGTGRLTERLAERLPKGRVVAIDQSANMITVAAESLRPLFGRRVTFAIADAATLPLNTSIDVVFSTATFHWILDHPGLFQSLHTALKAGGRLVAQCGGGHNIARAHGRCAELMRRPEFSGFYGAWRDPWEFADAETTRRRLVEAGFVDVQTSLEYAPVIQPDATAFKEFVANVICRPHLAYLPETILRRRFMDMLTEAYAADDPPFELDYWRLNMAARRP